MASRGVNKAIILGRVGKDPEVRYSPQGQAFASLTVATSETWRDKQTGEQKEVTEWHRVSVVGKLAEIAGEYVHKGDQVYFEGQIKTRKWQDQSGQERYTTEIHVGMNGVMQMLGSKHEGGQTAGQRQQSSGNRRQQQAQQQTPPQNNEPPMDFEEDIPF